MFKKSIFLCATVLFFFLALEQAETIGHTEFSRIHGDNYAVFRQGKYIYMLTGLAPARITGCNGKIVRIDTIMFKTLPVRFYRPATPDEEALWYRYF